ncbi:hypothetical protein EVAR_21687_1 [Eumeta japonica]|uniref:Uncharacterized protein n=1 Tax=Eumeta variegata TaxID=151549 RepID=A0A4C1W7L8_EUMVA|nr:hypothetical protein EVAR_21687_1 [Eumeta japonica]
MCWCTGSFDNPGLYLQTPTSNKKECGRAYVSMGVIEIQHNNNKNNNYKNMFSKRSTCLRMTSYGKSVASFVIMVHTPLTHDDYGGRDDRQKSSLVSLFQITNSTASRWSFRME